MSRRSSSVLSHPAVIGVATTEDRLLVCVESPLSLPRTMECEGRIRRVEMLVTGRFVASSAPAWSTAMPPFDVWHRPVQAGYSLGTRWSVGTTGLIVTPASGRTRCQILTAGHVVCSPKRPCSSQVIQPAGPDGGRPGRDTIGSVSQVSRLRAHGTNVLDAALIEPQPGLEFDLSYPGMGHLWGHCARLREGWTVFRVGRTTGPIRAAVRATQWSGYVDYPMGRCHFSQQVLIQGLGDVTSRPGDSGGVWVTPSGYAAALGFSATDASGRFCIATPIHRVLETFGVRVATPPVLPIRL